MKSRASGRGSSVPARGRGRGGGREARAEVGDEVEDLVPVQGVEQALGHHRDRRGAHLLDLGPIDVDLVRGVEHIGADRHGVVVEVHDPPGDDLAVAGGDHDGLVLVADDLAGQEDRLQQVSDVLNRPRRRP